MGFAGDAQLTIGQRLALSGAIIVSTPQASTASDETKSQDPTSSKSQFFIQHACFHLLLEPGIMILIEIMTFPTYLRLPTFQHFMGDFN